MSPEAPVVFVVDDEAVVRDTVCRMIREFGHHVEEFSSAEAFLRYQRPDRVACLVLDVMLPGSSGLDLVDQLTRGNVQLPTVFMTGEGDIPTSVRAMKAGAVEFLTKPLDREALRSAVSQAIERAQTQRQRRTELESIEAMFARLTVREREVLDGVVGGRPNKQIASDLGVVEQTVKAHRAQIMRKLEANSVADLVRLTERARVLRR